MSRVKDGDTVKVHYSAKLEDGTVCYTSKFRQPVELRIGSEDLLPRIENSIIDMKIGETKTIKIPPEEAYGPRREDLVVDLSKSDLPEDIDPIVGQQLKLRLHDDNQIDVTITEIEEDIVTLDANHPLAGIPLIFEVELVEII